MSTRKALQRHVYDVLTYKLNNFKGIVICLFLALGLFICVRVSLLIYELREF